MLKQIALTHDIEPVDTELEQLTTNAGQNIDSLKQLFELVNETHDDYIRYFLYNNKAAGVRLRKSLKEIVLHSNFIRNEITDTKNDRIENPFRNVRRAKKGVPNKEGYKAKRFANFKS